MNAKWQAGRKKKSAKKQRPRQTQAKQPGVRSKMVPKPESVNSSFRGSGLLAGRTALITGGDSGIGRATAIAFAREGADVAILFRNEVADARSTEKEVLARGRRCLLVQGDIGSAAFCRRSVDRVVKHFGRLDILVNNAAEQHPETDIAEIDEKQLVQTFRTNVFSMFHLVKAALPHLKTRPGSTIINTSSVTAFRGSPALLDYSATKGAITSFTRSLSKNLAKDGIRVNAVAPGPIWTPLIPSTLDAEKVAVFGGDTPLGRAGQPWECAECYVFLASDQSAYITGQTLHPNGGEIING